MFTNNLALPIESDLKEIRFAVRASHSDRTLNIAGMTWDDYEKFDFEFY